MRQLNVGEALEAAPACTGSTRLTWQLNTGEVLTDTLLHAVHAAG